jgi:hypothetical protein
VIKAGVPTVGEVLRSVTEAHLWHLALDDDSDDNIRACAVRELHWRFMQNTNTPRQPDTPFRQADFLGAFGPTDNEGPK